MEESEPQTPIPQPRNKTSFWRSTVEKHKTKKALQQSVEIKIGWKSEPQTPIPQPRNKSSFWRSTVEKHKTKKALQQSVEIKIGWQWWAKKMHGKGLWDLNDKEACPCERPSECFPQRMARARALGWEWVTEEESRPDGREATFYPHWTPGYHPDCVSEAQIHTYSHIYTYTHTYWSTLKPAC